MTRHLQLGFQVLPNHLTVAISARNVPLSWHSLARSVRDSPLYIATGRRCVNEFITKYKCICTAVVLLLLLLKQLIRAPTVYMTKIIILVNDLISMPFSQFKIHFYEEMSLISVSPNAWYLLYQQLSIITQCTAHLPNGSFNNYLSWLHDRFPCSRQKVYVFSHSVSGHWTLLFKPLNQWRLQGFKWFKKWWSKQLVQCNSAFFDWGFDLILSSHMQRQQVSQW